MTTRKTRRHLRNAANSIAADGTARERGTRNLLHAIANHMEFGNAYSPQVLALLKNLTSYFANRVENKVK